jgi:hypothetical protein
MIWLPFLAFGAVFILFAGALVMFSGRKGKRAAGASEEKDGAAAVARRPRRPARPAEPAKDIPTAIAVPDEQVTAELPAAPPPKPEVPQLDCRPIPAAEIGNQATGGTAMASLVLGVIGLVVCCLPILGLPVSITGLVLGIKGQKSLQQNKAVIGICLNLLGLGISVVNGLMWVRFALGSMHLGMH